MTDPETPAPAATAQVRLKTHAIVADVQHLAGSVVCVDDAIALRMIEDGVAELPTTAATEPAAPPTTA